MTSAEERRVSTDVARSLKSISEELHEINRLLSELLKFQLLHEGDGFKGRNESAKIGD